MKLYTAFCCENTIGGTIWIDTIEVPFDCDVIAATDIARQVCADCWEYNIDDVHCLGLAEGNVNILYWEDLQ